jgi:predicted nucleic acid-binding protein
MGSTPTRKRKILFQIAATAMHLNLPLISRDPDLRNIGIEIVWE